MLDQIIELKIGLWIHQNEILRQLNHIAERFCRARMYGKHNRHSTGTLPDNLQHLCKGTCRIHICGAVQCDYKVLPALQIMFFPEPRRAELRHVGQKRINHGITHEKNPIFLNARLNQVAASPLASREKPVGDAVCHHAINFFRHGPVTGTDTCLHMSNRYPQLLSRDGAGHSRSNITKNQTKRARDFL